MSAADGPAGTAAVHADVINMATSKSREITRVLLLLDIFVLSSLGCLRKIKSCA